MPRSGRNFFFFFFFFFFFAFGSVADPDRDFGSHRSFVAEFGCLAGAGHGLTVGGAPFRQAVAGSAIGYSAAGRSIPTVRRALGNAQCDHRLTPTQSGTTVVLGNDDPPARVSSRDPVLIRHCDRRPPDEHHTYRERHNPAADPRRPARIGPSRTPHFHGLSPGIGQCRTAREIIALLRHLEQV